MSTDGATPVVVNQQSSAEVKIRLFRSLFRGREDVYPRRFEVGLVPHYWALKVFWLFDVGAAVVHAAIGLAWQGTVIALLLRRFARVVRL